MGEVGGQNTENNTLPWEEDQFCLYLNKNELAK